MKNIAAEQIVAFVPDEVANGQEGTAAQRAMMFAQLGAGMGTPTVVGIRVVEGGFRVKLVEASLATAMAKAEEKR